MAGFPHHAIEQYLTKLIRSGYKVAVCDQLEDPKLVGGRTLVKRGVTEMVTPGIAFGENMLDGKEHNYLTGLTFSKDQCGAAFLDVSTGTFQVAQGSVEYIGTLIASLSPKEIVVQRGYEKKVKELYGENLYVSTLDEWAFVYDSAVEKLKRQLKVESLKGYAIDTYPLGICSAGALVVYLEQTQHTGLANICSISRIDGSKFVWMDRFTIRNLEIFAASSGGEGVALVDVIDKCCSPMGSRLLRGWLAMPSVDLNELNSRYDIVSSFTGNREKLTAVQEHIGNIGDLDRMMSRAATGKIMPREVLQLSRGLSQLGPIKELCTGDCAPLTELVSSISDCNALHEEISRTLTPEAAAAIGKGDVVASGVNEELDRLREISRGGKQYLLNMQQRETERTGISSLKIGYNNVFGYYIEVRNAHKDKVPEVVCMIQKEVAERIAEKPGSKTYGILSVLLQAWYDIEYLFTVGSGAFAPPPKVQSAVIRLTRNSRTSLGCDEDAFKNIVKTSFGQRRKTLRNSLKPLIAAKASREGWDAEALSSFTAQPVFELRPERLSVEDFIALTNLLTR